MALLPLHLSSFMPTAQHIRPTEENTYHGLDRILPCLRFLPETGRAEDVEVAGIVEGRTAHWTSRLNQYAR